MKMELLSLILEKSGHLFPIPNQYYSAEWKMLGKVFIYCRMGRV